MNEFNINKNTDKKTLQDFYEYLQGILHLYQDAVPVLKDEFESIVNDNIPGIDQGLKSQQALLFKTKHFQTNVDDYLSKLGISGETLSQVIDKMPEDQQLPFYELLGHFDQAMSEVIFYKDKCKVLLETKLYKIDKVLSKENMQKENTTYTKQAKEIQSNLLPKSFEKKV